MRARGLMSVLALVLVLSPAVAGPSRFLALELWINGACSHRTIRVEAQNGSFIVARKDLIESGLQLASNETHVTLGAHTEVRATLDEANQRLMIDAPTINVKPAVYDLRPAKPPPPAASPTGLAFNYDLSAQASDLNRVSNSGTLGFSGSMSLFSPYGVFSGSGFATDFAGRSEGARLDSAFVIDDPDKALRWTFGDAITGSLPWSQSERFAGVQLATDYTLRPDLVTIPLPQYFGDSGVPASVDVFIGATRVFEAEVDPGPFELRNLPIITGGGDATIVVNDALGRQTTQTIPLFETTDMLAPGVNEYAFEAGTLRSNYGLDSFDYGPFLASGVFRHGFTEAFTGEAQAEFSRDVQMAGMGLAVALEPYAVVDFDVAGSHHNGRTGDLASFSAHSRWGRLTAFATFVTTSTNFADLAVLDNDPMVRRRLELGLSASLPRLGTLSLSEIDQNEDHSAPSRLVSASYAVDFAGKFLTVTGLYDRCSGRWYASATFDILLGARGGVTASGSTSGNTGTATVAYRRDADPDGGVGYRIGASSGDTAGADASGVWYGDNLSATADISSVQGQTGMRVGIDGALVIMDDHAFATRQTDGAVALVKTGMPGIPIYQENRAVAVTDEDGEALIQGLAPYSANHIRVDPDDFPISAAVEDSERVVTPRRNSAVIVDFTPPKRSPLLVIVQLENGLFPPVGAHAALDHGDASFVVGRRGKLFIEDLGNATRLSIELPDGICRLPIAHIPRSSERIPRLGPILCIKESADAS